LSRMTPHAMQRKLDTGAAVGMEIVRLVM